MAARPQ